MAVLGLGLWLPGYPSLGTWRAGAPDPAAQKPVGEALGRMHRRRAGPLGRAVADVAAEAMGTVPPGLGSVATVVGSSIGEAATLVSLLEQMWRGTEPMSPADFTVSVHNAASGVLSIATGNRGFTTSIAADHDTPAAALYEGLGLVLTGAGPVLVLCSDEGAPEALLTGDEAWTIAAAGVLLGPLDSAAPHLGRLHLLPAGSNGPSLEPVALDRGAVLNPQVGLVDLVLHMAEGRRGAVRLDRGRGRGFVAVIE